MGLGTSIPGTICASSAGGGAERFCHPRLPRLRPSVGTAVQCCGPTPNRSSPPPPASPPALADRMHCPHPAPRSLAGQTLAAAAAPSAERRAVHGSLSFPPRHRGCQGDRICCGGAGPTTPAASSGPGERPRADFGGTPPTLDPGGGGERKKERPQGGGTSTRARGCHHRRGYFRSQSTTRCLSAPFTPRPSPHLIAITIASHLISHHLSKKLYWYLGS